MSPPNNQTYYDEKVTISIQIPRSLSETIKETVEYLNGNGERTSQSELIRANQSSSFSDFFKAKLFQNASFLPNGLDR